MSAVSDTRSSRRLAGHNPEMSLIVKESSLHLSRSVSRQVSKQPIREPTPEPDNAHI